MLFYGLPAVRQLMFPLLFLFLIVPIPQLIVDKSVTALQVGSSHATFVLFRWGGVPVLRSGFVLILPALDIEVAKQCSGIRSSLVLVISSFVLGHLYLRSHWGKVLLVLTSVPISIAKNAVRIFTLSMLGMHIDPGFLYGRLHRNGGIVFFVMALAALVGFVRAIQKAEKWTAKPTFPPVLVHHRPSLKNWIL
jgi:exosortase